MRYVSNRGEPVFDVAMRRHITDRSFCQNQTASMAEVFSNIYFTNKWGSVETRSGPGSERDRMKNMVGELTALMRRWRVRSLLDAPCGEFNWMRDVNLGGVAYVGVDIVPELIERNRQDSDLRFIIADITQSALPSADLVLCRDTLVHLSDSHVLAALANFKRSGSTYLLTTTFAGTMENTEIVTGWWRPLNLELSPFNLPRPVDYIKDADSDDFYEDKILALWRVADIPNMHRWL